MNIVFSNKMRTVTMTDQSKVEEYFETSPGWQQEMRELRKICLGCHLTEELKWGKPCYTYHGKNIVLIQGFKGYCALLFFKGFLLSDTDHILVRTGPNTRIGRQVRFKEIKDIHRLEHILRKYIFEAIELEDRQN